MLPYKTKLVLEIRRPGPKVRDLATDKQVNLRGLARQKTPQAFEALYEIATASEFRAADRIEAARILLKTGWGQPAQAALTAQTEEGLTWERVRVGTIDLRVLASNPPSTHGLRPDWVALGELAEWRQGARGCLAIIESELWGRHSGSSPT